MTEKSVWHCERGGENRYLGCKQRIRSVVNDRIGIEPNPLTRGIGVE